MDNFDKKIDDSDKKREKKTQYLTRKAEFANLLYLTGERYCASNFLQPFLENKKQNITILIVLLSVKENIFNVV